MTRNASTTDLEPTVDTDRMRSLLLVLGVFLTVWVGGYLAFARAPATQDLDALQPLTRSEDFLSGKRGVSGSQCLALPYQDAEVIAIGSSHVGAGIDSALFSKLSRLRTGVCALPRFNTDTLAQFIDYLDRRDIRPERIIWLADLSSLLQGGLDEVRLSDSQALFTDARLWANAEERWQAMADGTDTTLATSAAEFRSGLDRQRTELQSVDIATIQERIAENRETIFSRIIAMDQRYRPHPRWTQNVGAFCEALEARGIALDIVITPLPTQTAEISEFDAARHLETIRAAMPCVDRGVARDLDGWGLDTVHFLDRKMTHDFSLWDLDPEDFSARIAELSPLERLYVFDIDHLNAVGAEVFTRELVEALELD